MEPKDTQTKTMHTEEHWVDTVVAVAIVAAIVVAFHPREIRPCHPILAEHPTTKSLPNPSWLTLVPAEVDADPWW